MHRPPLHPRDPRRPAPGDGGVLLSRVLAVVLGWHLLLFWGLYLGEAELGHVLALHLDRTERLLSGQWPDHGVPIGTVPFLVLGDMAYLTLAPLVALTSDPLVAHLVFVAVNGLALVVLGVALRGAAPVRCAVGALALLLASNFWAVAQRIVWHPNRIPLFAALYLLAAQRLLAGDSRRRWVVLLAAAAAVSVQLHVTTAPLLLFVPWVLRQARSPRWRLALGVTALAAVPAVVANLRLWAAEPSLRIQHQVVPGGAAQLWTALVPEHAAELAPLAYGVGAAFVGLMLLGGWRAHRSPASLPRLALWLVVVGVAANVYPLMTADGAQRYLHGVLPPAAVLAAVGLAALAPQVQRAGVAALVAAAVVLSVARPALPTECSLVHQRAVARHLAPLLGSARPAERVHGLACLRPGTGESYFYDRFEAAGDPALHALVSADGPLPAPAGDPEVQWTTISAGGRSSRVAVYRPVLQTVDARSSPADGTARVGARATSPIQHVNVEVSHDGSGPCRPRLPSGGALEARHTARLPGQGLQHDRYVVRLPSSLGTVEVQAGPCRGLTRLDVY